MLVEKPGADRRERVEQDAPDQHAAPAEAIGEIAAEQPEGAADDRRHPEEHADPVVEVRRPGTSAGQLADGRADDERRHQHFVDVEREAERGDGADQPLLWGQTGQAWVYGHASGNRDQRDNGDRRA